MKKLLCICMPKWGMYIPSFKISILDKQKLNYLWQRKETFFFQLTLSRSRKPDTDIYYIGPMNFLTLSPLFRAPHPAQLLPWCRGAAIPEQPSITVLRRLHSQHRRRETKNSLFIFNIFIHLFFLLINFIYTSSHNFIYFTS